MARKRLHLIIIAWTLLITLMPVFIVKALHTHDEGDVYASATSSPSHAHGGGSDCLICSFSLSPFTEAVSFVWSVILPSTVVVWVCPVSRLLPGDTVLCLTRGPPALSVTL